MLVWFLSGWLEQHSKTPGFSQMLDALLDMIALRQDQISSGFVRFGVRRVREIDVPLLPNDACTLHISRMKRFSPTFLEFIQLVQKTGLDTKLVTRCRCHPDKPMMAARFFEWEKSEIQVLDNDRMKQNIVSPLMDAMKDGKDQRVGLQGELFVSLFFATGLRMNEVLNLRLDDVGLRGGTMRFALS